MVYCRHCGSNLPVESSFCFECGEKVINAGTSSNSFNDSIINKSTVLQAGGDINIGVNEKFIEKELIMIRKQLEEIIPKSSGRRSVFSVTNNQEQVANQIKGQIMEIENKSGKNIEDEEIYLLLGNYEYNKYNYEKAIEYYDKGLSYQHDSIDLLFHKAEALSMNNDWEDALFHYKKSLEINNEHIGSRNGIAYYHIEKENYEISYSLFLDLISRNEYDIDTLIGIALCEIMLKDIENAKKHLDKAHEINEEYAELQSILGIYYKYIEQYEEAIIHFNRSISIGSHPALISTNHELVGKIHIIREEWKEARDRFNKSLKISTKHIDIDDVYQDIGITYHSEENYPLAIRYYEKALERKETKTSYKLLGECYFDQNKSNQAIKYCSKAISMENLDEDEDELDQSLNYMLGVSYYNIEKYNKAIKYLKNTLIYDKNEKNVLVLIGESYFHLEKHKGAVKYLRKALKVKDDEHEVDLTLYRYLGLSYTMLMDFEKAIKPFAEYLKEYPDNFDTVYLCGLCYMNIEDYSSSLIYLKKAHELDNNHYECHKKYASALYFSGYNTKSRQEFLKIYQKNQSDIEIMLFIGYSYHNQHNYLKANIFYQKVLSIDPEQPQALEMVKKMENLTQGIDNLMNLFG